jgi:single-stranded-DNA-specific exonuclease
VDRFLALAAAAAPADPRPALPVDLALPAAYVDYSLYRDLARLAPCGTGNPEPLVAVLGLTVQRVRAANGGHTQLVLRRERDVLDGIAFGRPDLAAVLSEGDRVDVVARLASRVFGGLETLQLEVRDVSASGSHPRAAEVLERAVGRAGGEPAGPGSPVPVRGGIA